MDKAKRGDFSEAAAIKIVDLNARRFYGL